MIKMKCAQYLIIGLVLLAEQGFSQSIRLSSPDGKIKARFHSGNSIQNLLTYDLVSSGKVILKNASVGLSIKGINDNKILSPQMERKTVSAIWQPVYGERKNITDKYNQLLFRFKSADDPSFHLAVTCRAYNEGFAFQYKVIHENKPVVIENELSQFQFPVNASAWVSSTAQGHITEKKIKDIKDIIERPVTIKVNEKLFVAVGEASLVNFSRMKFSAKGEDMLVTKLYDEVKGNDSLTSPWRFVLIGKNAGDLLEKNYLLLNLNEPSQIANAEWIQPGKVLRESTLTTKGSFECIDFAASHNIRYICFDAGWYGKEDSDTSDATRVAIDPARSKGSLDLKKVIAYGKQKNVGVILYVNRRALERQLDTLLPLYQSWGVKGLKFGFVQVGSQEWTSWLHEAIRKAAKYNMVVDIHDEYRPTGYTRTYPNLLTQEGIRGDEESPFTEHTITTLFTRMIAGPADNTICYFNNRVNKMSSHVAQMAKAVCIYSPLQFLYWYDRPVPDSLKKGKEGEIMDVPELKWFNDLPVVWDDTKVLESDMEKYATIARKKGDDWFIGSLNGQEARTVNLKFKFLNRNKKYKATIYADDSSMNTITNVKIKETNIDHRSVLSFDIAARNGIAVHITPR